MSEQYDKPEGRKQEESGNRKPLHKMTRGAVQAAVWDNGPEREPTVSLSRNWRDAEGRWHTARSFPVRDLDDLARLTEEVRQFAEQKLGVRTSEKETRQRADKAEEQEHGPEEDSGPELGY